MPRPRRARPPARGGWHRRGLLPGGLGTLEELFEVYTWAPLGLHRKPCGLLDVDGYYAGIADFLAHAVEERFLREEHRRC